MYKLTVGSFIFSGETKLEILEEIESNIKKELKEYYWLEGKWREYEYWREHFEKGKSRGGSGVEMWMYIKYMYEQKYGLNIQVSFNDIKGEKEYV